MTALANAPGSVPDAERGLTLVELLLALGLLSGLSAVIASWSVTTLRGTRQLEEPARWRTAARSGLRHIQEALLVADEDGDDTALRARFEDGVLSILSRSSLSPGRTAIHAYRRDASRSKWLLAVEGGAERILLLNVKSFDVELDESMRTLFVRLESGKGGAVERRFRIP